MHGTYITKGNCFEITLTQGNLILDFTCSILELNILTTLLVEPSVANVGNIMLGK